MKALLILEDGSTQKVDLEENPFRKRGYFLSELESMKEEVKNKFNNSRLVNKVVRVHLFRN